jgi:hypothetical protein
MAMVHDGDTDGYAASNAWYPAESLSVTVLYNGVPRVPQDVDGVITQIALGLTPTPRSPAPPAATPASVQTPTADTAAPPADMSKLLGEYEMAPGRSFVVTFDNGTLYVTPPGSSRQRLFLQSGTRYAVGSAESTTTATFVVDADGVVTGFIARQNGSDRSLRKIR